MNRPRAERLVPAAGGFLWLVQRVHGYPTSYLFVPSLDILVVQIGTWIALLAGAAAVGVALWLPVRLFRRPAEAGAPRRLFTWILALGVLLLGLALRLHWLDLVPPGFWVDGVHALKAAAEDGRFFGPHEGRRLLPLELGSSRVAVYGLYLDFLRALLLSTGSRFTAYTLMNVVPAALIPLGVFLLGRRLTTGAAPLFASFLAAVSLWPLVLSRWGWDQQLMSVLLLLALERLAAGVSTGRAGPLLAGGFLAGLACHTFVGGLLGAAGLLAWLAVEARIGRSPRRFLLPAAALFAVVLPLALLYVKHPELLGGRLVEARVKGSAAVLARDVALNTLDYAGEFFFTPDPNVRHGLREPQLTPGVVGLLALGLVAVLHGDRVNDAGWRGFAALFGATLAGGILSAANAAPSSYRTGLAGALAWVPIGVGLAHVAASPFWSGPARRLLSFLLPALILFAELSRFATWGLPDRGAVPAFGAQANAVGRFLGQVGSERVVVDPAVFDEDVSSPFLASFRLAPEDARARLPRLRLGKLEALPSRADLDWYVTAGGVSGSHALHLGFPGGPDRNVVAVRVR